MTNPALTKLEAEEAAIMHELNVLKGAIEKAGSIGSARLAQMFHSAKDEIEIELKKIQAEARDAAAAFSGKVGSVNVKPLASAKLPAKEDADDEDSGDGTEAEQEEEGEVEGQSDADEAPAKRAS